MGDYGDSYDITEADITEYLEPTCNLICKIIELLNGKQDTTE